MVPMGWGITSTEPIKALRARLTQDANRVAPAKSSRRKLAMVVAFGGASVALVTWLLVSLLS